MPAFDFLLAALATWRVSALLVREDGPYDVLARLRRIAAHTMAGRALACFYCTSAWVAAPAALWTTGLGWRWPVTWLALSGAACLLDRATAPRVPPVLDLADAERVEAAAAELLQEARR